MSKFLVFIICFFISLNSFAAGGCCKKKWPEPESEMIMPESPRDDFRMRLSGLDQFYNVFTSFALAFPTLLDRKILRLAIAFAQNDFSEFGSRLVFEKEGRASVAYFTGAEGIVFEFQSIGDRSEGHRLLRGLRIPALRDSPEMRPLDWTALHAIHKAPQSTKSNTPLVFLRLTRLEEQGVSILGLCANHVLGDAATYVQFLQTVSYYAGVLSEQEGALPAEKPLFPIRPSEVELTDGSASDRQRLSVISDRESGNNPFFTKTTCDFVGALPKFLWRYVKSYVPMTFVISKANIAALKAEIVVHLRKKNPEAWVSTYEVIMASVLEGIKRAQGVQENPLSVKMVVNLRGRTEAIASPSYIGNASSHFSFEPIDQSSLSNQMNDVNRTELLAQAAMAMHSRVRRVIDSESEEFKCGSLNALEGARSQGRLSDITKALLCHAGGSRNFLTINNLNKYPWLEGTFGSSVSASVFGIPEGAILPGMLQINPRSSEADAITLSLPEAQARALQGFFEAQNLPFVLVE